MEFWDNFKNYITNAKFKPITPKQDLDGVNWDQRGPDDFNISQNDPRYIESRKTALEMKEKIDAQSGKTYGELLATLNPKNPDDFARIVSLEKEIVTAVNNKVHEQFGVYNANSMKTASGGDELIPSIQNDLAGLNSGKPAQLIDYKKDELACRHFGPLANVLLSDVLDTERYSVLSASVGISHAPYELKKDKDGNEIPENHNLRYEAKKAIPHTMLRSNLTGYVIDFTAEKDAAYKPALTKISPAEFEQGAELVTSLSNGNYMVFNIAPKDSTRAAALAESIDSKLGFIADQANRGNSTPLRQLANDNGEIPANIASLFISRPFNENIKHTGSELTPPPAISSSQQPQQQSR